MRLLLIRNYLLYFSVVVSGFFFIRWYLRPSPHDIPQQLRKYLMFPENYTSPMLETSSQDLMRTVEEINNNRSVLNWEKYSRVEAHTIIVINVNRDAERLQYLIVSLAEVEFISTVLLVFSHRFYDPNINELIRKISFCKVMQIFFPYSLQLFPHRFPGDDPTDCHADKRRNRMMSFCVERNAVLIQKKQHWWWTAYFVFEKLEWLVDAVIFLEEDNYVTKDLLYMLQYTQRAHAYFPHVQLTSFGNYNYKGSSFDLLSVDSWSDSNDLGLALNQTMWRKILDNAKEYCLFNDSKWASSLMNLFSKLPRGYAQMVSCVEPRVISTRPFRSGREAARQLRAILHDAQLFPKNVRSVVEFDASGQMQVARAEKQHSDGQFSHARDQLLCLDPMLSTTTIEYNQDYLTSTTL